MENRNEDGLIAEKRIGISPDYQYRALNSSNFLQANWHNNKLVVLGKELSINKDSVVLDLGTGSGNFEFAFWKSVKKIIGVDYNDEALAFLSSELKKRNIGNVELRQCDIRNLASLTGLGKVDAIVIMDVIEHIRIEEAKKVVGNIRGLLNAGGAVYVITPNYRSPWRFIEVILDKVSVLPKLEDEQHLAKYHKKNLCQLFSDGGFKVRSFHSFNLFSFIIPGKKPASFFCKLELLCPFSVGNLIFGVFEKKENKN